MRARVLWPTCEGLPLSNHPYLPIQRHCRRMQPRGNIQVGYYFKSSTISGCRDLCTTLSAACVGYMFGVSVYAGQCVFFGSALPDKGTALPAAARLRTRLWVGTFCLQLLLPNSLPSHHRKLRQSIRVDLAWGGRYIGQVVVYRGRALGGRCLWQRRRHTAGCRAWRAGPLGGAEAFPAGSVTSPARCARDAVFRRTCSSKRTAELDDCEMKCGVNPKGHTPMQACDRQRSMRHTDGKHKRKRK